MLQISQNNCLLCLFVSMVLYDVTTKPCVPYKEYLPSGECAEYLEHAHVLLRPKDAKGRDGKTWRALALVELVLQKRSTSFLIKNIDLYLQRYCGVTPAIKNQTKHLIGELQGMKIIYNKTIRQLTKWVVCHMRFVVCMPTLNGSKIISLPCRDMYDSMNRLMPYFFLLYKYLKAFRPICTETRLPPGSTKDIPPFPDSDIRHVENCQRYDFKAKKKGDNQVSCYDNKGAYYNGSVHVTKNGTKCVNWNSFYSLRYAPYSRFLIKNYCRNPQGIGNQPWCYTNRISRGWGYCPVPKCTPGKDPSKEQSPGHETNVIWYVVLSLVLLIFFLCFVILKRCGYFSRLFRTGNIGTATNIIEPNYTTLLDQQNIRNLIGEHQ